MDATSSGLNSRKWTRSEVYRFEQTSRRREYYDLDEDGAEQRRLRAGVGLPSPPRHLVDAASVQDGVPNGCDTKQARTQRPACEHTLVGTVFVLGQPITRRVGSQSPPPARLAQVGCNSTFLPQVWECGYPAVASTRSPRDVRVATGAPIPL